IAHLPGQPSPDTKSFLLTDADAQLALDHHARVVTTVNMHGDSASNERVMREQYRFNLELLKRHGVPLLVGSDVMRGTAVTEIAALARSGVFTNQELLRMWSVTTPRAIFPMRGVGELRD